MPQLPSLPRWLLRDIAGRSFQTLNLDHPHVASRVLQDLDTDIQVYYDQRWQVTERFCRFLLAEPVWVADRTVLVLGAGVGLETLAIGSLCRTLYLNDLSCTALALCTQQLRQNGLRHFICLPGRYEHLSLPAVDIMVGCFLVYSRDTAAAMRQLLDRPTPPVLLANDNMPVFRQLLHRTTRPYQFLLPPSDVPCVLFGAGDDIGCAGEGVPHPESYRPGNRRTTQRLPQAICDRILPDTTRRSQLLADPGDAISKGSRATRAIRRSTHASDRSRPKDLGTRRAGHRIAG
jgi:hypothetical protein